MNCDNRLFFIREHLDYTQAQMAKKLKVSRAYYSLCETNTKFMPLNRLNDFCNIFQVDIDYVYYLTNKKTNNTKKINKINPKTVGNNLSTILKDNNVTQKEIAQFLNTTQSTISSYCNGHTIILTSFAVQLAKKYSFSLDWLIGRSDIKKL